MKKTALFQTKQTRRNHLRNLSLAAASSSLGLQFGRAQSNSSNPSPIKIGQIGVGHAHATKLSVYRESSDYEVIGVVEPNVQLREAALTKKAFQDLAWKTEEQLLNTPGLQAVLVETEVRDLLSVAERCIAAGLHIHLDKPAGDSLNRFQGLLDAARQQQLLVQMGYMYRYNPAVLLLRQFLEEGWLGEIFEVHTVMSKVVPPDDRRLLAEFSGGIMFELGGHILDLTLAILGKPSTVNGHTQAIASENDGLMDNMLAVLTYPRALATVKTSAIEVDGGARRHLVVCGRFGTFHIQPLDQPAAWIALDQVRDGYVQGTQTVKFPKFVRYVADAADMAKIIRREKPADFSYEHDLAVQETLLKASGMDH
jgi:predicted dehydrogenase